jgi:sugar O-acyltransferase (sialic acid O-acetyltransferase NeuD family)
MSKIIIFGLMDNASLAHFYFKHDSDHEVTAFCVNRSYIPDNGLFEGLPVVAFEEVEALYPPDQFKFFAPLSPQKMNKVRESIYIQAKGKGYEMVSYISSRATTFPGAEIGENCFILEDNTIQPYTKIGNNVILWSGNHIGHHSVIKDHVFFTSHVVLSGHCTVEPYSFFGVNSTIRDATRIAEGTLVAMSASVIKDTEPWGVYKGNPAKKAEVSSRDIDL